MIVSVNSQRLAQALRPLVKIVPTQPAIQILGYVLIVADDALRLSTTDLEVGLSLPCPATITAPGTCALPAATLLQLVEQFTDGTVTLLADASGARIQYGTFSSRLQTLPPTEFPALPTPQGHAAELPGMDLGRLILSTRYAVADRGKKHVLEGALLKLEGTAMGMVATDSVRLSIATAARTDGPDLTVIVPRKTLDALPALGTGKIRLTTGVNHLFFSNGEMLLTSRVIEGTYPAYERIIPRDHDKTLVIRRDLLAAALKRVGIAADANGAIYCSVADGSLRLAARSAAVGEADEQLTAQYSSSPLTVCINWRYLLDFLTVAVGETITITMKNEKSALLVADGPSFINVISIMK